MLYGNESISHYSPSNIVIWMTMAFQAGLLNIGGFMSCHRFVSHITGFATFFGHEFSYGRYKHAIGMLAVPIFFLLGVMLSAQMVDMRLKLHKKPRYYFSFGVIFFLILIIFFGGISGFFGPFGTNVEYLQGYILIAALCMVCGIQNGTITSVSKAVIRTTHLTGLTTDLGIGIIRFINKKKLHGEISEEFKANFMRLGIILSFCAGSIFGGLIFKSFGFFGFLMPSISSGLLFSAMLYFQVMHVRHKKN